MKHEGILNATRAYYESKLRTHGATSRGVDWSSAESQNARFEQFARLFSSGQAFSLNDFGCGYGALYDYLVARSYAVEYCGFDISGDMVARAKQLHPRAGRCRFLARQSELGAMDYTVASGIFNVRQETSDNEWQTYLQDTLHVLSALSTKGFAFNVLTKYSDPPYMRPDLFYADPCILFDYCKRHFSRQVALLHDYGLYEFTILVRQEVSDDGEACNIRSR
jgi:SAM-dependent methyltransferase